jgi:3-mercaptopyruvate sulfurtransferase SseA
LIRNYEQIKNNIATKKEILIDARPSAEFNKANIPNSINVPYDELFDPETETIRNKENLIKCDLNLI